MLVVAVISLLIPTSVVSNPGVRAVGQLRCVQPLSTWAWRKGVKRRVKDQSKRLSVALPPSTGPFRVEKFGTMASSATDGSSNVSVPTKNRLPAIPCAPAECAEGSSAKLIAAWRTVRIVAPCPVRIILPRLVKQKTGKVRGEDE